MEHEMARYKTGYIKYLTDDEFKKIKQYVEKLQSPSMRICLKVLMYLGLRSSEAIALKRQNFNKSFSKLIYTTLKSRKVKERHVPSFLGDELAAYHRQWHHRCIDG